MSAHTAVGSRPGEEAPQVGQPGLSAAQKRLEDQIAWYDLKSQHNQRWFKALKICQIVVAAAIPVGAAASAPLWLIGCGGALIVVLEGLLLAGQHWQLVPQHDEFQVLGELGLPTPNGQPQNSREDQVSEGEQHRLILPRPTLGLTISIAGGSGTLRLAFLVIARARLPKRNAVESGERRPTPLAGTNLTPASTTKLPVLPFSNRESEF